MSKWAVLEDCPLFYCPKVKLLSKRVLAQRKTEETKTLPGHNLNPTLFTYALYVRKNTGVAMTFSTWQV